MSFSFPPNPSVGDQVKNGNVTYTWDGTKWVSTNGPFVEGSTGPTGATGATGPVGEFDGNTPLVSQAIFSSEQWVISGISTTGFSTDPTVPGFDSVAIGPRDNYQTIYGGTPGAPPAYSNLMFNHYQGAPQINGNSARLSLNTTQNAAAALDLGMKSNVSFGVTTSAILNRVAQFREDEVNFFGDVRIAGEAFVGKLTGNIDGDVTGNAGTATKLQTPRSISLAGDVAGSTSFDGSANVTINSTIQPNSVQLATDTTGSYVQQGNTAGNGLSGSVNTEAGTFTVTSNAIDTATPNTIVFRNASGNFNANRIFSALTGNVTGNADTASRWATARTLTLTGDLGGSVSIDGSANVNLAATIQPNSVQLATDTTGDFVRRGATSGKGISGSTAGENQDFTVTSNATESNSPSTIVFRDTSGNFSAGTITATLSGNASTASLAADATTTQRVTISADNGNTSNLYLYFGGASGNQIVRSDNTLRYRANTNTLTTTNLTSSGTINANNITATGTITGNIAGNSATASRLTPGANINGVLFTGASNITITANTPNSLTPGSYIVGSSFNGGTARTWNINATSANTADAIVARNGSGDFNARNASLSNLFSSGEVRAGDGAANNPSFTFNADQDTGIYRIASNVGGLSAAGVEVARWDTVRFGVGLTQNRYLQIGAGNQNNTNLRIYKRDNNVSDHIQFYNGNTRIGEIGGEDDTWLRINQETAKNIYTPRYILAGGGFRVGTTGATNEVISSAGVHIGNGSGLTNLNASSLATGEVPDARLPNSISSDITGNAATATRATTADVTNTNSGTYRLVFSLSGNGQTLRSDTGITVQPGADLIQASTFRGTLDGSAEAAISLSPRTGTGDKTVVNTAGMYTDWNRVGGTGSSYFINQRGTNAGGWRFVSATTGNVDTPVLLIEEDGRVTIQGSDKTFVGDNFTGTAANANTLDSLDSTQFIRRDANQDVNATTEWQDNREVRLGSGADMRLYHDGNNSYIDNYEGDLYIRGVNANSGREIRIQAKAGENSIYANADGGVILYFNAAEKLRTTGGGISVTGTVAATSYTGSGASLTGIIAQSVNIGVDNSATGVQRIPFVASSGNSALRVDNDAAGVRYQPSTNTLFVGTVNATHTGNGASLTNLNATNLTGGTVPRARLSNTYDISITGNANTATSSNNVQVDTETSTNATRFIMFADGGGGSFRRPKVDGGLTYNPSTNTLTASVFAGSTLTGNGAGISNINASNITSGEIGDAFLPNSISSDITGTANNANNVRTDSFENSTNTQYITFVDNRTGNQRLRTEASLTYRGSGNIINANISGNSATSDSADNSALVNITTEATNTFRRINLSVNTGANNTTRAASVFNDDNLLYNPATNELRAGSFVGSGAGLTNLPREIPAGTRMLFNQPSTPTGWTRIDSGIPTNAAIRINRNGVNFIFNGGSTGFNSTFVNRGVPLLRHNHTASTTQNGSHAHSGRTAGEGGHTHSGRTAGEGGHNHQYQKVEGTREIGNRGNQAADDNFGQKPTTNNGNHGHNFGTNNNGNHGHNFGTNQNGLHGHNLTTSSNGTSGAAMNFEVKYTDVIIASKN